MDNLFRPKHACFYWLLLCTLLLFLASQNVFAAPQPIGQVVWSTGDVKAVQLDHSSRALQRRSVILEHDTIVTGQNGTGEIVFTDGGTVSLRSGTELKIDSYHYTNPSDTNNKYIASLAKGGFRTITGFISKGHPDRYLVNTPVGTIGVRGTEYVIVFLNGKLLAGILRGAIFFKNDAGVAELSVLTALHYLQVDGKKQAPIRLQKQPTQLKGQPNLTPAQAPSAATLQQQMTNQNGNNPSNSSGSSNTSNQPPGTVGGGSSGGTSGGSSSSDTTVGGTESGSSSSSSTTGTGSSGSSSTTTTNGSTTTTGATPNSAPAQNGGTVSQFCIGGG